ncbi:PilZ domain-containing protein [Sphingomonas sp. PAMC 26621]|uniref:PilZ domain-containing protein n=1 Tax=Sphingomonas sp. PAMC 26621 TaxID=1112213 RepID=UPI000289DB08|nr:PilZ domain-containing protein [Sphingomonas sp. PAMC 26621]
MVLTAQLFLEDDDTVLTGPSGRLAERLPVQAGATLRDDTLRPVDADVIDLSTTGCLIVVSDTLAVPSEISIGIAGIGRVSGRIVRGSGKRYGCAFDEPLSEAAVLAARAVQTVVPFATPATFPTGGTDTADLPEFRRLPMRTRLIVIVGASLALWGVVVTGVVAAVTALS